MTDTAAGAMQHAPWFADQFNKLLENVKTFIRGEKQEDVVRLALVCMLSEGHLLLDDFPGLGKTSLARAIANSVKGSMGRIQFTPDLLPSDVTGGTIWNAKTQEFEFRRGAIFNNIVIADEINRASPKTQSALLEVMEERQVTADRKTHFTPRPFVVIATQNPIESEGTYPLPEAQLDRFMLRTKMGYPDAKSEAEIVKARAEGQVAADVGAVMEINVVKQMMAIVREVYVAPALFAYATSLARYTRGMQELRLGVSPRGSGALIIAAKAFAASHGSGFVTADHIKYLVQYVFAHRMLLSSEAELQGHKADGLCRQVLNKVEVPARAVQLPPATLPRPAG